MLNSTLNRFAFSLPGLLCLGMALALSLAMPDLMAAEPLRCLFCGKAIKPGSNYIRSGDKSFCSEACFNAWAAKTAPKCVACGKPVTNGYTSGGKAYCSMECLSTTLPKCVVCGCRARQGSLVDGDPSKFVCDSCMARPKCFVCNLPSLSTMTRLEDGRLLCTACAPKAVFDAQAASGIFESVRKFMRDKMNLSTSHSIAMQLVSSKRLSELSPDGPGAGVEMGLFEYSALLETTVRDSVDAKGRKLSSVESSRTSEEKWSIYALYGLTEERLAEVFAHELAHDWMQRNCPYIRDPKIKEGWAEYIAWRYNEMQGRPKLNIRIERNTDPVYGAGFQEIRKIADKDGFDGLKRYLRKLSMERAPKDGSAAGR